MSTAIRLTCAALLMAAPLQARDGHAGTIVETAVEAGSFNTLITAVKTAGLADALSGEGPLTVFAPTDEAFASLPKETLAALLRPENRGKLTEILTYHVVPGSISAKQAIGAGRAASLQKGELAFRIDGGRLLVNEAVVVGNDVECSNGVIHVIDSVLLPAGGLDLQPAGRLIIGVHCERPSRALAEQLQVDRHGSLLLTGVTSDNPAERAGLRKYDLVIAIDGEPATGESLAAAKERVGYGGRLALTVVRRGQPMTTTVDVGIEAH